MRQGIIIRADGTEIPLLRGHVEVAWIDTSPVFRAGVPTPWAMYLNTADGEDHMMLPGDRLRVIEASEA